MVKVSLRSRGTKRNATAAARRRSLIDTLTAAAPPRMMVAPVYDLVFGSEAGRVFAEAVMQAGYREQGADSWPCDSPVLQDHATVVFRDGGGEVVYRLEDGSVAHVVIAYGWVRVRVAAPERASIAATCGRFRSAYPASYITAGEDGTVPITFWANSKHGPVARLRKIEASRWTPIESNYTATVRSELAALMGWTNGPPVDGQLLLWQGPPGTGKSWALRALASEWAPWAEFNYITDPDSFFIDDTSYMIEVLLHDSYDAIEPVSGDVYSESDDDGKWRVLILEDTGELLSANAKEKYGQGLSRLLNVVDGMIGQGLKVLALVTTNDELGALHPAVSRPGRCASQIEFAALTDEEAQAWTGQSEVEGATIAELYHAYGRDPQPALAIDPVEDDLIASLRAEFAKPVTVDVRAEVARVAADHADEAVGYGECAYNEATGAVLYVCGDWTDPDPIAADMLAIHGVDSFEHEAEALPDGWWDADVVYPADPPRWVTDPDLSLRDAILLAQQPLDVDAAPATPQWPAPRPQDGFSASSSLDTALSIIQNLTAPPVRVDTVRLPS